MAVVCTVCGKLSQDPEFCDFCNSDLLPPVDRLPPARCPIIEQGITLPVELQQILVRPESSVTLPVGLQYARVHWVGAADRAAWLPRLQRRLSVSASCLMTPRLQEDVDGCWIFVPAGTPWTPWFEPALNDPVAELGRLLEQSRRLAHAFEELHRLDLVCLNFEPRALEELPSDEKHGPLGFACLDTELFPRGHLPETVRVHRQFAAPEVMAYRPYDVGPATDVFHLAIFCYASLAGLLPDGFSGNGLESFEYQVGFVRIFAPHVVEGVWDVLKQGLALEPARRFATPSAFVDALSQVHERATQRRNFSGMLSWDLGSHTRTGKLKSALNLSNEDRTLVRPVPNAEAALVAVADGVSTCHVGSGGLASLLTMFMLETNFSDGSSHEQFPAQAANACRNAAQSVLDWAFEKGYRRQLMHGADLMGTTLTLGWLQGREISLANLGDSRAYLITDELVEQLTVDGDLTSSLLAKRMPPEEVRALGNVGRALRECVGGCVVGPDGEVSILPESTTPSISRWPLIPGDVVVLCTDGLVDEGIFLEPTILADLVRKNRSLSATELALLLVEAADALQWIPTPEDPDGMGDNVSCVVIKIEAKNKDLATEGTEEHRELRGDVN